MFAELARHYLQAEAARLDKRASMDGEAQQD